MTKKKAKYPLEMGNSNQRTKTPSKNKKRKGEELLIKWFFTWTWFKGKKIPKNCVLMADG